MTDKCPECGTEGEWLTPAKTTLMVEGEMRVKKKIVACRKPHSPGGHACMKGQIARLKGFIAHLVAIKEAADGQKPLASCQGQAMDGFTELANYRSVVEAIQEWETLNA